MLDYTGRVMRERDKHYAGRTIVVLGVATKQSSRVGARVKSTVFLAQVLTEADGRRVQKPRQTRIQEHVLASRWTEVRP